MARAADRAQFCGGSFYLPILSQLDLVLIYFSPTIIALRAHIAELQVRLQASEAERQQLLDRLLLKHNFTPVSEGTSVTPRPSLPLHYIAPPGVNPIEIQDAIKDHWLQEETDYFVNTLGYDYDRARSQAEQNYKDQHGITH